MSKNFIYGLLITLIVCLFLRKSLELIIDTKFTKHTQRPTGIWKLLVNIKDSLAIISIFLILSILFGIDKKSNLFISTILLLYLVYYILFVLLDWGYIFLFIEKTPEMEHKVHVYDIYLNSSFNVFLKLFSFYALVYIFYKK